MDLALIVIEERRKAFRPGVDETLGRRYHDDDHVILLLRSSVPEEQFALGCNDWVDAALHAAAAADRWYNTEKDYGNDHLQEEPEEPEEDLEGS